MGRREYCSAVVDAAPFNARVRFGVRVRLRRSSALSWSALRPDRRVRSEVIVAGQGRMKWVKSVMRAKTVGGGSPVAVVVVEVAVVPAPAIAFPLELPVGDHEVRVRDTATTLAALHGSRL